MTTMILTIIFNQEVIMIELLIVILGIIGIIAIACMVVVALYTMMVTVVFIIKDFLERLGGMLGF